MVEVGKVSGEQSLTAEPMEACVTWLKLLRGTIDLSQRKWGNNRSVMPLDVLGRTRATMMYTGGSLWLMLLRISSM